MLKADRKRASRKVALLIMRKRQRCLEESQSPNEVDMEGGRHRIAVPGCSGNVFASLMDLRVIHRHHDRTLGIPLQILINDGIKQLFRLPGTPRKKLIVGVPVLLGAAQYTDALGNGAVAHGCWPSQRVLDCTPVRAAIGENIPPALLQHRDIVLGQRHGCPPLRVKTFLSLRRNRSPRAIFLTSEDTTDSRSRRRPCSFSIRSRISEIWRGLPARRSTSCTISSCDVRLSPAGSAVVLDFARRIARSWASRAISKALRKACSIGSLSSAVFLMADISCAKTCGNGAILRYVCQYNSVVDLRKCLNSRFPSSARRGMTPSNHDHQTTDEVTPMPYTIPLKRITTTFSVFISLVMTVLSAGAASAQVAGATLSGTSSGASGAVMPGAMVSIRVRATG